MKVLGIDPGSTRVGYALIDSQSLKPLLFGLLEITTKNKHQKLKELGAAFQKLLNKTKPDTVAIEKIFFSNNQKTAIDVAESRGALKLLILQKNIKMFEYTPQEIKIAVTNYGSSDKKSVALMVSRILSIPAIKGPDDISDALAIAITGALRYKMDSLS